MLLPWLNWPRWKWRLHCAVLIACILAGVLACVLVAAQRGLLPGVTLYP